MSRNLTPGWTEDIDYILAVDGTAQDLTDMTVAMIARDSEDTLLTLAGAVSVVDASAGQVRFSPAAADIIVANQPYRIRFKVTDTESKIAYFPNKEPELWYVRT